MSFLSDWYLTVCLNLRAKEASDVIAILDALDVHTGSPPLAAFAVSELARCDVGIQIYAIPKLLRLGQDRGGSVREHVECVLKNIVAQCGQPELIVRLEDLLRLGLRNEWRGKEDPVATTEFIARQIAASPPPETEVVPYLGLSTLVVETVLLGVLQASVSRVDFRGKLVQQIESGRCPSTQSFLDRARSGAIGRLAVFQATAITRQMEGAKSGTDLALALVRLSGSAGLLEPDIGENCARLVVHRIEDPVRRIQSAEKEFETCAEYVVISRAATSGTAIERVAMRLGIRPSDVGHLAQLVWEGGIVATCLPFASEMFAKAVSAKWGKITPPFGDSPAYEITFSTLRLSLTAWLGIQLAVGLDKAAPARGELLRLATRSEREFFTRHNHWLSSAGDRARSTLARPTGPMKGVLPGPVTGFVLFVRTSLTELATHCESLPLNVWLEAADGDSGPLQVLNRWAEGVFMAPPGDGAVRRWKEALPRLIGAAGDMRGWGHMERQLVALLERFFLNPSGSPRDSRDWWDGLTDLESLRKANLLEDRLTRRILAFPPPDGRDWIALDWLCQKQASVGSRTRLVAVMERFLSPDDEDTKHLRPGWASALAAELAQVFFPDELDRWARQRLLDVVRHPQSGDAGRLAVQLIIQLGRPVDIARLVSALLLDNPPDLAWKLQYSTEGLAARGAAEMRNDKLRSRPNAPRVARRVQEDAAYWYRLSATLLAFCPDGETANALRMAFSRARGAQAGLHRSAVSTAQAMVESLNRRPMLVVASEDTNASIYPWMIEQVIEDPVHGQYAVLYSRYWLKDEKSNKRGAAIVVGDFAPGQKIAVDTYTGRAVVAPLARRTADTGRVVLNLDGNRFAHTQRMPSPSSWYRALGRRKPNGCEFEVDNNIFSGRVRQPPPELWDVDEAWRFEKERPTTWKEVILVQENRTWKPARLQLHDLIAQEGGSEVPFSAQLTFVAVERGNNDRHAWLFSSRPGTLFELGPELFTPDSASLVQKYIAREENEIRGLRIRVTAVRDGEGQLVLSTTNDQIDRCNLDWRDLFSPGMAVTANRLERSPRYVVSTGAPAPFPGEVEVCWEGEAPRNDRVTGVVTGWSAADRLRPQVRLERAEVMKLRGSRSRLVSLHADLTNLREGDFLTLTQTFGEPRELGNVLAVTQDGLGVQVAAESLNMLADGSRFIPAGTSRRAIIVRLNRQQRSEAAIEFSAGDLAQLRPGEHVGIVFEVPNRRANHHVCQVLFVQDETGLLVAATLRSDSPSLGSKVFITVREGVDCSGRVENLMIFAEALYTMRRVEQPPPDARFVGTYVDKASRVTAWIHSQNPGELILSPPGVPRRLFGTWRSSSNKTTKLWPTPDDLAINIAGSRIPPDFKHRLRDVYLKVPDDNEDGGEVLLPGWCPGLSPVSLFAIRDVELHSVPQQEDLHWVRRIFQGYRTEEGDEEPDDDEALDRTAELTRIEEEGHAVPAILLGDNGARWRVLLPALKAKRFSNREATLEVPASELHCFPDARGIVYDNEDAKVAVMQSAGIWQASFRRVPPISLEQFREESGVDIGIIHAPITSLVFVGRGDRPSGSMLLFEYGFGRVVEIDPARVRIDNEINTSIETVLFHGDQLKSIKFVPDEHLGLCLCVLGVDIAFGDAHHVFLQASQHRFVHTLVLEAGADCEPRIVAVKGFNDGGERTLQEFSIPNATLSLTDMQTWRERFANSEGTQLSTYARLNTKRFVETNGQVSEFQPVPFSFGTPDGLKQGDRLLVEAGELTRTRSRNDVWLALYSLPGVESSGGRKRAAQLGMLRRDFSVRDSLLTRFLGRTADSSMALQGMIFAVTIMNANNGSGRCKLLGMLPRRTKSLPSVLRSSSGPIFATTEEVKRQPSERRVRLEVRPGIFFELTSSDIDGEIPDGLAPGTLVRLDLANSTVTSAQRVRLTVCQFSSWRYLSHQTNRPGIVLPIDRLLDQNAQISHWNWSHELFTASDFTVKFSVASGQLGEDGPNMGKFMSRRHPKLAWLGRRVHRDGHNEAVFVPAEDFREAGFLLWGDGADVRMARPRGGDLRANWHLLSFADVSIATLKQRCEARRWFIHDHATGYWTRDGTETADVGEQSVRTGRLFFDPVEKNGGVRLRYEFASLPRLGTPLGNIADAFGLEQIDGSQIHRVTVAAVQQAGGRFEGVWIEWVPGRVMEVPVALLSWRCGPELLPLTDFDWNHLACGDELALRLVAGETLSPDRIEVLAWYRGPRGICIPGRGRALLPCQGPVMDGGMRVGAGAFQLTLPVAADALGDSTVLLGTDNHPVGFGNQRVRPGDVVLVAVGQVGGSRLTVMGWPEVEALPDLGNPSNWNNHPFTEILFSKRSDVSTAPSALVALIRAVGGALPVTVERADPSIRTVFFSFREQPFWLTPAKVSQALALGTTEDQQYVAIWLGRGVSFLAAAELVAGVTSTTRPAVVGAMIVQAVPVWVRAPIEERAPLVVGLTEDVAGDLWVIPVLVGRPEQESPGLLVRACKSQRLYWIPREYLAWVDLTAEEIDSLLVTTESAQPRALRARLKFTADGFALLSLLDTAEARREESELLPGRTLVAEVVKETRRAGSEGTSSWLVRSRDTGLLLRCDVPTTQWLSPGTPCVVEISFRRFEQTWRVVCTPQGLRQIPINLPEAVVRLIKSASQPRLENATWRDELVRCSKAEVAQLHLEIPADGVMSYPLIHAWELSVARKTISHPAAEIALLWLDAHSAQPTWQLHEALLCGGVLGAIVGAIPNGPGVADLTARNRARLVDSCWEALTKLLAEMHRRLIRSQHIAVLLSRLSTEQIRFDSRFRALHARLSELISNPLTPTSRAEVLRLAEQLMMDGGSDRHELGGALMACLGMVPPPQAMPALSDDCADEVCLFADLARVCSPFAELTYDGRVGRDERAAIAASMLPILNAVLNKCRQLQWEMILLESVPPLTNR